jgi:hypothetical protein
VYTESLTVQPLGKRISEVNHFRLGNALQISVLTPLEIHLFEPNPVGKKYSLETGFCEYSLKKVARTSTGTVLGSRYYHYCTTATTTGTGTS